LPLHKQPRRTIGMIALSRAHPPTLSMSFFGHEQGYSFTFGLISIGDGEKESSLPGNTTPGVARDPR
jgi:hypothetical protein